jgi:hypothetical protein
MDRDLFGTLRLLRISGILAAAIRTSDGRYRLWLGDTAAGVRETASVPVERAPAWLVSRALHHYPRSDFAKVRCFLERMQAEARSGA